VGPKAGPDVSVNAKILLPPGIEHRTAQPVAWSLHGQRHPGFHAFNNSQNKDFQKGCYEVNYEREREPEYTTKFERAGVDVKGRRTEIP